MLVLCAKMREDARRCAKMCENVRHRDDEGDEVDGGEVVDEVEQLHVRHVPPLRQDRRLRVVA